MKVAKIYIRVSTQEQALEGYSIQAQKERLINYAKAHDYIVDDIYIDDGYTGSNLDRPALKKLLDDIKNTKIDVILVFKLDRISRSQKDTLYLIEDVFLKNNISFVSMQESFDTSTPFGRAMVGMLSVFAQLERENIRERTMMGRCERAKAGLWGGGVDPFGYDYVNGKLIKNANSEIVKKAYELYLEGYGTPTISKKIGGINRSKVRAWLLAPVYAGKIAHAGKVYPGQHEGIVDWDTFLNVQEIMECRSNKRGKPVTVNLLAGLVKCAQCGATYGSRSANHGKHRYLMCYSRTGYVPEMIKDANCTNEHWRLDKLTQLVEGELMNLAYDKDYFRSKMQEQKKDTSNTESLNIEIKDLDKKIKKLTDLMLDEDLQIDTFKEKAIELNERKKALQKIVNEAEKDTNNFTYESMTTIRKEWENLSIENKNEMLRRVIDVIWVNDFEIKIEWKL